MDKYDGWVHGSLDFCLLLARGSQVFAKNYNAAQHTSAAQRGKYSRGASVCQIKACGNAFDVTRKERAFEQVRRKDRSHGHKVGHLSS